MGRQLKWLAFVFTVALLAALADEIPPLKQFQGYLAEHPQPWLGLCIGATIIGFTLLGFVWGSLIFGGPPASRPRPRSRPRQTAAARGKARPVSRAVPASRFRGEASIAAVKEAFRTGDWIADPVMRPFCIGFIGLLFVVVGVFGFFIAVGPPSAQLLCGVALIYALGQIARAFTFPVG